jgi:hypothetical protein
VGRDTVVRVGCEDGWYEDGGKVVDVDGAEGDDIGVGVVEVGRKDGGTFAWPLVGGGDTVVRVGCEDGRYEDGGKVVVVNGTEGDGIGVWVVDVGSKDNSIFAWPLVGGGDTVVRVGCEDGWYEDGGKVVDVDGAEGDDICDEEVYVRIRDGCEVGVVEVVAGMIGFLDGGDEGWDDGYKEAVPKGIWAGVSSSFPLPLVGTFPLPSLVGSGDTVVRMSCEDGWYEDGGKVVDVDGAEGNSIGVGAVDVVIRDGCEVGVVEVVAGTVSFLDGSDEGWDDDRGEDVEKMGNPVDTAVVGVVGVPSPPPSILVDINVGIIVSSVVDTWLGVGDSWGKDWGEFVGLTVGIVGRNVVSWLGCVVGIVVVVGVVDFFVGDVDCWVIKGRGVGASVFIRTGCIIGFFVGCVKDAILVLITFNISSIVRQLIASSSACWSLIIDCVLSQNCSIDGGNKSTLGGDWVGVSNCTSCNEGWDDGHNDGVTVTCDGK